MYKVMIVEDEPPILFLLKNMIDTLNLDFQVSAYAFNGKEALQQLSLVQPDVLITDIRMPFIDGLQLINEVKSHWPHLPCIILSGYNDFDYVREALQLNTFDYIVKPIKEEHLVEVFRKIAVKLEIGSLERERELLKSIVHLGINAETEFKSLPYSCYYPLVLLSGNASKVNFEFSNPGNKVMQMFNTDFLQEYTKQIQRYWCFEGLALNEKLIIFALDHENDELVSSFAGMIIEQMQHEQAFPHNIMIGNSMDSLEKLQPTIQKLRVELVKRLVIGQSNIFRANLGSTLSFNLTSEVETRCRALIKQDDLSKFKKSLVNWSQEWAKKLYTQSWVEAVLNHIVRMFQTSGFVLDQRVVVPAFDANELITGCINLEQVIEKFCAYMKVWYDQLAMKSVHHSSVRELISQIELYIEQNYMRHITNETFQDVFGYNSTYISNIFSEIKGVPPSKYIMKVRVKKAIQTMKAHPRMSLKAISELIGYDDPLYFSRVFKKTTGFSPKEYKERILNGQLDK